MDMFERIARSAVALILMFSLGFFCGYWTHGSIEAKKEIKVLQTNQKETAQNITQSTQASVKVDTDIDADHARLSDIRSQIAERLAKPTYQTQEKNHADLHNLPETTQNATVDADCNPGVPRVLDADSVRLLNAARQGTELRAAGSSNGQEPAAAGTAR